MLFKMFYKFEKLEYGNWTLFVSFEFPQEMNIIYLLSK